MLAILSFLKALDFRSWIIIGLSVTVIGLWAGMSIKTVTVGKLKNEINEKELVIEKYKTDVLNLTEAVKRQNLAVEEMSKRNKDFEATLNEAGKQNAKLSASANKMIGMIKNSYVPPDCKGATDHLNTFTKEFGKEWNHGN